MALVTLMSPLKTAQDQDVRVVSELSSSDPVVFHAFLRIQKFNGIIPDKLMEIVPGSVHVNRFIFQYFNFCCIFMSPRPTANCTQ